MDITRYLAGHQWEIIPTADVEAAVADVRLRAGCKPIMSKLLTWPNESTKFRKGDVPVCGVSMLPHRMVRSDITLCPNSTPGCRQNCIVFSGRGACGPIHAGRAWKTDLLIDYPDAWFSMFCREIHNATKRYDYAALRVRPNVFSDVHWEKLLPESFWMEFKHIRFMDYTKGWRRTDLPRNYRLVFSASERTPLSRIEERVGGGGRVAVVFDLHKRQAFPKRWEGMRLVDGDVDDDLWSRPAGAIVALRAKGRLRKAQSAFKRKVA